MGQCQISTTDRAIHPTRGNQLFVHCYSFAGLKCLSPKLLNEKGPLQGSDGIRHPPPETLIEFFFSKLFQKKCDLSSKEIDLLEKFS